MQAKSHVKKGEIEDARTLYQSVLQAFPKNKQAQKGLAALSKSNRRNESKGPHEHTTKQLVGLYNQGELAAVVKQAQALTEQYPESFFIWNILGAAAAQIGQLDEAVNAFQNILSIKPNHADAYYNMGNALKAQGKLEESIASYTKAVSLQPDYTDAYYNMGNALKIQGKMEQAIASYKKALSLKPSYAEAYSNMGNALQDQGKLDEAIESYKKALSLRPDYAEAYYNMGNALKDQGKLDLAIASYEKGLSVKADFAEVYNNMGKALKDQGKLDEAARAYEKALSLKPDYAEAHNNMGRLHWLNQNFNIAFELMEWRWRFKHDVSIGAKWDSARPEWNGEYNTRVFVWKEQGIGDEIMLGSTLKELNSISIKVIVECDKRLIPLYSRSFPKEMKFLDDRHKLMDYEYNGQIAIGSLLNHFRQNLRDFRESSPGWLKADRRKTAAFRKKVRESKSDMIIGISWFTKSKLANADKRNLSIQLLANYLNCVPARYVNLQYGVTADDLSENSSKYGLHLNCIDELDLFNDLDGLAALISACDIVISVDNATVHLAGALGIDTRVLLPLTADERWGLNSIHSYWYDSVTLYRQGTLADWNDPLQRLMIDLKNKSSQKIQDIL